jgi:ubiquinone/menaquinone biosynthesis C-methylase UbiE
MIDFSIGGIFSSNKMLHNSEAWSQTAKGFLKISQIITIKYGIKTMKITGLNSAIQEQKKLKILDIACGTGDLGIEIARLAKENKAELLVTSTDFAQEMINLAKENSKQFETIHECLVMNANKIEFKDSTFDFTYSIFGVLGFPERKKAMKEIYRTLKNGGIAGFTIWKDFPSAMNETMEEFGMIKRQGSQNDMKNEDIIVSDLKESGFEKVEILNHEEESFFEDFEDFFNVFASNPGMSGLLSKYSEEEKERFLSIYRKHMLKKFSKDEKSATIKSSAMIVIASK